MAGGPSNLGRYTNVLGYALPGATFNKIAPGADVNIPADGAFHSLTAFQSLACTDPGQYLILFTGSLFVAFGAVLPTQLTFQAASSPNANTDPHDITPAAFVANSTIAFPIVNVLAFVNPASSPNPVWQPGQGVTIQVKSVGQAVTIKGNVGPPVGGTQIAVFRFRRDD